MKRLIILFISIIIYNVPKAQALDTLISINGYKLHFNIIKGNNSPILFEAGNGDDGSVWQPILEDIHKATGATLITYDRAGLGKSEIDTTSISFENEIINLEKALRILGYTKNLFLVALHNFIIKKTIRSDELLNKLSQGHSSPIPSLFLMINNFFHPNSF